MSDNGTHQPESSTHVLIECSRCQRGVMGFFILTQGPDGQCGLTSAGFLVPMASEVLPLFQPGEVALCQECLNANLQPTTNNHKPRILLDSSEA